MRYGRLFAATALRTLFFGGITVGLCFAYPPLMGLFIGLGAGSLGISLGITMSKASKEKRTDSIPRGDLEFHVVEEVQPNVLERVENFVFDKVEQKIAQGKYKKEERKLEKQEKSNNKIQDNELSL